MNKALTVAKFLYHHDGNRRLPTNRDWEALAPYWQSRYLALAEELLEEIIG